MLYNGGYVMINVNAPDVYDQANACLEFKGDKAILLNDNDNVSVANGVTKLGDKIIISTLTNKYVIGKSGVTSLSGITDMTKLTDDQCNALECGDIVLKKTTNQYHSYRVSYKEKDTGMCLTYVDATSVETISYDYTGGHWVYNSTDHTTLTPDA